MTTIRKYAKENNFEIIGKLTRRADRERIIDALTGKTIGRTDYKCYEDEAGNEYIISAISVAIVTLDGAVI